VVVEPKAPTMSLSAPDFNATFIAEDNNALLLNGPVFSL
jgi:hypothetical protein